MSGTRRVCALPAALLLLLPHAMTSAQINVTYAEPTGVVDCLLPGPIRRIGGQIYQMPQRPAR
ncbi:MAG: hypothetical protein MI702_06070, partial [Chlorobiales bacterium]|nr:hypothetical protein [Chlorobiales bacterium]